MISLRYFVLILLTLCCREIASDAPRMAFETAVLSIVGLTIGFAVFTKTLAYQLCRHSYGVTISNMFNLRDAFVRHRYNIERVWCVVLPLSLLSTGWFSWTQKMHASGWPQALVIMTCFLPTLVFLMLLEITSAQLDQLTNSYGLHNDTALSPKVGQIEEDNIRPEQSGWMHHWLLRIRLGDMAGLVTCLFPIVIMASISDCVGIAEQHFALQGWWLKLPLVAGILFGFVMIFPTLLTYWTGGQPMPQNLKDRVNELIAKSGIRGVGLKLIPSQHRWAGAAIVGWFPRFRHLWLGDAIVQGLSSRQLDMVVFHELAHVRRMHFLWRMLPMGAALAAAAIIWAIGVHFHWTHSLAFKFSVGFTAGFILLVGLSRMARSCELDADKIACDLAMQAADWSTRHSPAQELGDALRILLDESPGQDATWLHPSLSQRLAALSTWRSPSTATLTPVN